MAQITIYLSEQLEARARRAAKARGTSVNLWIAEQVARTVEAAWPPEVMDAAGAFPDFPAVEDLRRGYGRDAARENIE
jgi:hypothetical protein